ncbi:hypothetical protein N566_08105 [Streptomycetaceae bacterium MP113-05]|nr:hypothetical protein N566_08105 [Streptomycetaceae bacterium MP113-05]
MRKIRTAAAVAAMVVGLGTVGTTTAAAFEGGGGSPVTFGQENNAACNQAVEQNSASLLGDVNLGLGLGLLGQGEGSASSDRSVTLGCEIGQENEID